MATGPEHYTEAEELLAEVTNDDGSVIPLDGDSSGYFAAADVHATLALAAATALRTHLHPRGSVSSLPIFEFSAWVDAAGSPELRADVDETALAYAPALDARADFEEARTAVERLDLIIRRRLEGMAEFPRPDSLSAWGLLADELLAAVVNLVDPLFEKWIARDKATTTDTDTDTERD